MPLLRNRKIDLLLAAALSVIGLLGASALVWAGVGHVDTRITDNSFNDWEPQISGNNVVWSGNTGEIYFYNGSTTSALTANSFVEFNPQISGNKAVWAGNGGPASSKEIYLYNGSTVTTLTVNSYNDVSPQISGNNIVWEGWNGPGGTPEIYLLDGADTTALTANAWFDENPQISGNNIVWQGAGGPAGTNEIYFYNGTSSTVTTLTANGLDDVDPQISGNNAVWYGTENTSWTSGIYFYNGTSSTVTTLTAGSYAYAPQISGNNVVWQDDNGPGNTSEIYFYNGSTTMALTNNSFDDDAPQISGNKVVWYGGDWTTGGREIYFFNGSTVTTITANSYNDVNPQIYGDTIVWQGAAGPGDSYEIFKAQIDEGLPSDPVVTGAWPAKDVWTNNNVVLVNFSGAADASTGVDGFSIEWSGSPSTVADAVKDREESAGSALSPALADGDRWFHLRTRDNAGNWTSTIHYGPFKIDAAKPTGSVKSPAKVKTAAKTARVRVSWSGSDSGSGVKTYDVGYRIGKRGRWKSWKTGATALRARFTAKTGKIYYFRARAKDAAGNTGAWSLVRRTVVRAL